MSEIHVCQAGSCRRKGSEAVFLEIEELADALQEAECSVERSGCLGLCSRGPAAVVVTSSSREIIHTRINTLLDSANVVESTTGELPNVDDPQVQSKLSGVRAMRKRETAIEHYRWNEALKAVSDEYESRTKKGQGTAALGRMTAELISNAGFEGQRPPFDEMPEEGIQSYTKWALERVTKVTKHSAVFHFTSKDRKRGTPFPRGGGRSPPRPKTWHVTLLGEVGKNEEGPLPWVERDYTPVSSAKDWERGQCDILIKIYGDGAATSWLHRVASAWEASPQRDLMVWLSKPVPTLSVPYLVSGNSSFNPASVLLLLAGTGVVALPQILHHRDPTNKLGISTRRQHQLHVPVDLMLSCRADDLLMLPEIATLCQEALDFSTVTYPMKGVRRATLLVTGADSNVKTPPYPEVDANSADLERLKGLSNTRILETRLSPELVSEAVSRMPTPCRVVVSGPSGFNSAARSMLLSSNVSDNAITILEA
mmetsp:Transcript_17058/g.34170  ORF Transcript_17058/g.34170 Transcript_17058/m.34170 type:complete len:482 (+) Transcript_17058:45-1490(+)